MKTKIQPTNEPTALRLIEALQHSENYLCSNICKQILNKETTISDQLELGRGKFMTAVLNGDFETAVQHADVYNKIALVKYYLHE